MFRVLAGLAVFACFAGDSATAPIPLHLKSSDPPLYFPTSVGAKWVYETGKEEFTRSVTASVRTAGGWLVTVTNHRPGGLVFTDKKMLVTATGVTQVEGPDGKLSSPWRLLKIPHIVGEKWESDCSNEDFAQVWECSVIGTQEVEVPAGKFTAVGVRSTLVAVCRQGGPCPTPGSTTEWYAPGVGVVKVDRGPRLPAMVLKSFTP